jgi:hypothetical protein
VTTVEPTGNRPPDTGLQFTGIVWPRSVAVGDVYATGVPLGLVAGTVMSLGVPLITGGVVSRTWMVAESDAVSPAPSVAVHVTVVLPIGK